MMPFICNNYLYAITDNTGFGKQENRLLFKIRASDGFLEEVLNFGYPLSICASPVISDGKLFEAGVPVLLGEGEKCDWLWSVRSSAIQSQCSRRQSSYSLQ